MIYIPSFINIGSGIQKLVKGIPQTHRQHGDLIRLFLFFQNKGSRLKIGQSQQTLLENACRSALNSSASFYSFHETSIFSFTLPLRQHRHSHPRLLQ
jgi:hypothetical protein